MQDFNNYISHASKENTWLFNSAGLFSGNVKYLFIYINLYRPDIFACYISGDQSNVDYVRSLGFRACHFKSTEGAELLRNAGVYVNEHCKEIYPVELLGTKILNLYHGVGLKQIEKKADREFLSDRIAKKHIKYNEQFSNNMCFLVTSPFMEKHFKEQIDLSDDQIIRAGYPRNIYQNRFKSVETFNHDILKENGLKPDTKIAIYAPTFREKTPKNFLYNAIKDIDRLSQSLEKSNTCLIIKLHPEISNDFYFKTLSESTDRYKNIILWDNQKDIYEIFNKIDLAIVDYSSIYYDLLAAGVKNFIRYIFDYEDEKHIMIYDYEDHTTGDICKNFDELLYSVEKYAERSDDSERERINQLFWSYDNENSFDNIIDQTLNFKIGKKGTLPSLYSFDVFDTLISRKCLLPKGVFVKVMESIRNSNLGFPSFFFNEYVNVRMQAEANCRELLRKTAGDLEITFDDIFNRMQEVHELSNVQIEKLKEWEIEFELDEVIPYEPGLEKLKSLLNDNEKVILISDMYLPAEIIRKMINKACPVLAELPLYVSSEHGVQKHSNKLYLKVYKDLSPWKFKEWIHHGDNAHSDGVKAKELGIQPIIHSIPKLNAYEKGFINKVRNYDSYLITGMLARMRSESISVKDYFTFSQVSAYMVPYVAWCLRNAVRKNIKTLYFISRDGHFLKEIADELIIKEQIDIKVKYLYGSRRAWRVPAMVNKIDDEFFTNFGNLVGVDSYGKLLSSLNISHNLFQKYFPDTGITEKTKINAESIIGIREYFSKSEKYRDYLLSKASKDREIVKSYLAQEIDFNEKYAFVEYWARGYTQSCLANIIDDHLGSESECIFYYYRSILPTQDKKIRINYSTNTCSLIPVEAIFANSPHGTVLGYKKKKGTIVPDFDRTNFDAELYWSMSKYLKEFVHSFYSLPFNGDLNFVERSFSNFAFEWYRDKQDDPTIVKSLGHLLYSEASLGNLSQFAPAFNMQTLDALKRGRSLPSLTRSLKISLARSTPEIRKLYIEMAKNGFKSTGAVKPKQMKQAINSVPESIKQKPANTSNRKLRLANKLERDPIGFFSDSSNSLIRIAGKTALNPLMKPLLGNALIKISKKVLN
ncbi:CDP-glycerol glycerophosphotransferase family protein [Candidatus Pantoea formicae]|uniref:CDP-glycerol glycerophosphotransferase family protein n=1 Tax=Candidatus Pantoea formicae TaxID=2608355 RepID=UPI003EDAAD4E